jgi:hypothetical protein
VTQWDGTVVALQSVITGSNGVYTMPINVANARELSVTLAGSGAIAHIAYHMCSGENDPNSVVGTAARRNLQDMAQNDEQLSAMVESSTETDGSAPFCQAQLYPCESGSGMVHVCHYSARRGYQTFCIPEADSEILRFYTQDYCGPCVGGYAEKEG